MPVYLCQPGAGATEPWRYGIQVYAEPFPIDQGGDHEDQNITRAIGTIRRSGDSQAKIARDAHDGQDIHTLNSRLARGLSNRPSNRAAGTPGPSHGAENVRHNDRGEAQPEATDSQTKGEFVQGLQHQANHTKSSASGKRKGVAIRRVRHAEVLLVDDVCLAFGRYWLRLRWPGSKGGFAGYIDWGKVEQGDPSLTQISGSLASREATYDGQIDENSSGDKNILNAPGHRDHPFREQISGSPVDIQSEVAKASAEDSDANDDDVDDVLKEGPQDNASIFSSEPFESVSALKCLRTGLVFPSSVAMRLLDFYDDGLIPPVSSAPLPSEPVFCRICREGLHDDADEQQPTPTIENDTEDHQDGQVRCNENRVSGQNSEFYTGQENNSNFDGCQEYGDMREPVESDPIKVLTKGPVLPHPLFQPNSHAAENPILAPCECSGSMAFVHYLCVEQWRCRSRHPEACNGLNCETCGGSYALPPPSARPVSVPAAENDDWLDAMPPHVLAALRNPHFCWQVSAMVVQKRWLRPIAPIIMSPLVALYCRARRLLKKKGVARRRWACSLCRRRARWKCVRCLRSYYCSRQCQNVSWHIVHKYVCYKPTRWWGSMAAYSVATILVFPGILRDPFMYDLGLGVIPASFYVSAVLGGGIATLLKKSAGLDLRGRTYETSVVAFTVVLVAVTWGLIGGFFGDSTKCLGIFGNYAFPEHGLSVLLLRFLHRFVLSPAQIWFRFWDNLMLKSGPWARKALCTTDSIGCFTHLPHADADFILSEGNVCASDVIFVSYVWVASGIAALGSSLWKRRERQRRAQRRPGRDEARPHQD